MKYVFLFISLLLSSQLYAQQTKEIIIAADFWCPFNCQPNSKKPGYMIEIAQRVFAQHNINITYQIIPWSRALKLCRVGNVSAVVGAYKSDAPDFVYPDVEQGMIGFSYFNLVQSTWSFQGITSLEPKLLAIAHDYTYSAKLNGYIKKYQADQNKIHISYGDEPLKKNIQLLEHGFVDVLIESDSVFWYVSKQLNSQDKFSHAGNSQKALPAYIAFSPKLADADNYAKILSTGTQVLRESGELAEILAKYGLRDWR